jgi:hypothetical protein
MLSQARMQARARRVVATLGRQDGAPLDAEVVAMIAEMKRSLSGRNMRAFAKALLHELDELERREGQPGTSHP